MSLFYLPYPHPISAVGTPLPGAKLYFYQAGTTTPKDTFTDEARTVPHTNPVEADSEGVFPAIYLADNGYKIELKTALDLPVRGPVDMPGSLAQSLEINNLRSDVEDGSVFAGNEQAVREALSVGEVESGIWTPVLYGDTVVGSPTYTVNEGQFQRIGNMFYLATFRLIWTSLGSASGAMKISGLPYPVRAGLENRATLLVGHTNSLNLPAGEILGGYADSSNTIISLRNVSNIGTTATNSTELSSNGEIYGNILIPIDEA